MQQPQQSELPDDSSARRKPKPNAEEPGGHAQSAHRSQEHGATASPERSSEPSAWTWQVIDGEGTEIDGEAVWIDEANRDTGAEQTRGGDTQHTRLHVREIAEHYDDVVVASIQTRTIEISAGEAGKLLFSLLNNGDYPAIFEVNLEGWIDDRWLEDLPLRLTLEPGERVQTSVLLAPPRLPSSRAGTHQLALVVRAPQYPERYTRAAATLVIRPYAEFTLGYPQPANLVTSWLERTCTFSVPVTNVGNAPLHLRLFGTDPHRECSFTFFTTDWDSTEPGQTTIEIEPGQTAYVAAQVAPLSRPVIGFGASLVPFRLVAVDTVSTNRQFVEADLQNRPLIGPWHLAGLAGTLLVALIATLLIVFALFVTLRASRQDSLAVPIVQQEQPAPVVALVLQVDKPLPTRAANMAEIDTLALAPQTAVESGSASPGVVSENDTISPLRSSPNALPVVSADQVTAPGEPTPITVRPLVAAPPQQDDSAQTPAQAPASEPLTYGDMFREVGLQYDISWKVLAAQAYIESGFDSLALGQHGDLGLMQIQPNTWREWSTQVNVSDPFDSHSNVLVAAAYLDFLRTTLTQEGYGGLEWTLVAYNWGPDNVLGFLRAGGTWDDLDSVLKQYALDVLQIANSIPSM